MEKSNLKKIQKGILQLRKEASDLRKKAESMGVDTSKVAKSKRRI